MKKVKLPKKLTKKELATLIEGLNKTKRLAEQNLADIIRGKKISPEYVKMLIINLIRECKAKIEEIQNTKRRIPCSKCNKAIPIKHLIKDPETDTCPKCLKDERRKG